MKRDITEKLLSKYKGGYEDRIQFQNFIPIEWHNIKYCSATNGHHLIMIPETDENKVEDPRHSVDIASVIPEFNKDIVIDLVFLKSTYDSIQIIERDKEEECQSCEGEGEFDHYGDSYDCKCCDGKGTIKTGRTEKVKDPEMALSFGGAKISHKLIKTLIECCIDLGCETIKLKYSALTGVNIFELNDGVIIGIMPLVDPNIGTVKVF